VFDTSRIYATEHVFQFRSWKYVPIWYNTTMSHRSIVPRVAQNVRLLEEMRKVTWPSRQETMRLTLVVIVVSLVVGLYVG
jgi:hypothetical protein